MLKLTSVILNQQRKFELDSELELLLKKTLDATFQAGIERPELWENYHFHVGLSLVSEKKIRQINGEYRDKDSVTDILSFPMFEFHEGELQEMPRAYDLEEPSETAHPELYLGDLILCPQRASEQAESYGHGLERECAFLCAHGMLHLLGWDHILPEDEERMRRKQREVMKSLHLDLSPDEEETQTSNGIQYSAFIALLGRPNVGKSTLLNQIASSELAITSPKPQTTRNIIRAVLHEDEREMIFLDTPGIHRENHALDRSMTQAIRLALEEADIIVLIMEAGFKPRLESLERRVVQQAKQRQKELIIVLNKSDIGAREQMLPLMAVLAEETGCDCIIPLSARTGEGIDILLDEIRSRLPLREAVFTEDNYTNQSERNLAKEFIRQEVLYQMEDEIPHGIAVRIDDFEEEYLTDDPNERSRVIIEATIICDRENHKGMLLGKNGSRIREIGTKSRERISAMLDCPCVLKLYVKVSENWRQKASVLKELGYGKCELD